MKTYTKEQFWQECLRNKPDLTWHDFNTRWTAIWNIAHAMGICDRVRS